MKCLTTTIYGLEYITHEWVDVDGVQVLRMVRENGETLTKEELK